MKPRRLSMARRLLIVWSIFIVFSAALVGRLFVLTVFPSGPWSHSGTRWQDQVRTRARLEHLSGSITDDARGQILYRTGEPISTSLSKFTHLSRGQDRLAALAHFQGDESLPNSPATAKALVGEIGLPDEWPSARRVVPEQGRSGLEFRFDTLLTGRRPGYVGVIRTPAGNGLYGATPAIRGTDIRTTLDAMWQQVAEGALVQTGVKKGAVVILNTRTNEVLAMASRSSDSPFDNVAVKAASPGSVFKLITAAAAYESYRFSPESQFFCPGYADLSGVVMRCWRTHGRETLRDAIAESCDAAFAVVGSQIGRQGFETVWKRLHLSGSQLQTIEGPELLPDAEGGVLFRRKGADNGLLANTAIGQEDVQLSPLAAANLASTIVHFGRYRDVVLVKDAERQGKVGRLFSPGSKEQALSPQTAAKLADGMIHAVRDPQGTAHDLDGTSVTLGAKTGTAELVSGRVNAWMVGFAPAQDPEVAFCVVDEDVPSLVGHRAVHEVVRSLLKAYRQFPPTVDIR